MNLAASNGNSGGAGAVILAIFLILLAIAAYWVPSFVAWRRQVRNVGSIVVLNFFAFLAIPWIIALAMALADPPRPPAASPPPAPGRARGY